MGVRFGDDVASWVKFFLEGVIVTAEKGTVALNEIMALQKEYEEIIKEMGSRSANALKLIDSMYQNPFIDITKTASNWSVIPYSEDVDRELSRERHSFGNNWWQARKEVCDVEVY